MTRDAAPTTEPSGRGASPRLRRVGETCLWLLVIGAAVYAALRLAAELRLVVLPVLLALVLATLLELPAGALRRRGLPNALAALLVVLAALVVLGALGTLVWNGLSDVDELDVSLSDGIEEVQDWLRDGPVGLSDSEINRGVDNIQEQVRSNVSAITTGAVSGAVLLVEVLAGLLLALVLLFFLLKDGDRIWRWLVSLAPRARRRDVEELGSRCWTALGGFLRGQTIVALFDAVLIGLALVLIGVPFVIPLALLTFFGAFVPFVGATVTGLAAVLVALVANGPVAALLVLAAIIAVQQFEGNVLEPVVVGHAVHVHPIAILLGVTAGAVTAGIIGAMVAAPTVAVAAAMLAFVRERRDGAGDGDPDAPPRDRAEHTASPPPGPDGAPAAGSKTG